MLINNPNIVMEAIIHQEVQRQDLHQKKNLKNEQLVKLIHYYCYENIMNDNIVINIIDVIAGLATASAFIIAVFSYRSFRNAEEIKLAESIFKDLRELEKKKYELPTEPTKIEAYKDWASLFFNTLEWFSFLVNKKKIKDNKIPEFFKQAIIAWYEKIFLDEDYVDKEIIDNQEEFPEFKKLYTDLKKGKYDKPKYFDPNEFDPREI